MEAYSLGSGDADREEIIEWLNKLDATKDTRMIDLNTMALARCSFPLMKGRTSIKVVLPAVLAANPAVLDGPEKRKYANTEL